MFKGDNVDFRRLVDYTSILGWTVVDISKVIDSLPDVVTNLATYLKWTTDVDKLVLDASELFKVTDMDSLLLTSKVNPEFVRAKKCAIQSWTVWGRSISHANYS